MSTIQRFWQDGDPLVRAGQYAQGLRQIVLIGIALLLPWLGVSRTEIGNWEQMQYIGYLVGFAWLTGLGQAYLAAIRQQTPVEAAALTARLVRITLAMIVMIGLLFWWFERPVMQLLQNDPELPGWKFYLLFLLAHWPGLLYEQVLIAQRKVRRLVIFATLANGALALALILPLVLGYAWSETLLLLIGVATLKFLLLIDPATWKITSSQPSSYPLLQKALPLIGYAAIGALVVSFDPWFVNFWYAGNPDQFAIYRYGTRELPLIVAITNGIGLAVLPILGEDQKAGLRQLKRSSLRLMHLFFPATCLLLLTSPWWWTAVFTQAFAGSLPLFQAFVFVGISRMIFPIVVLTATGHGKALLGLGLLEFGLNAVFSLLLVPKFGLAGIVWATVIAYTLDKFIAAWWLFRKEGIRLADYCPWPWLLAYSALLSVVYGGMIALR